MENELNIGNLVKIRKFDTSRFDEKYPPYTIGIIIEINNPRKMSIVPRALILCKSKVLDAPTFYLEKIQWILIKEICFMLKAEELKK